jgi:hypothetical protein
LFPEFEGLPSRELRRFELFDSDGRYAQLSSYQGTVSIIGEIPPTTSGKKEDPGEELKRVLAQSVWAFFSLFLFIVFPDLKVVVISAPEVLEFRLRGDSTKSSNYYFWARTARAWYCLKSVHGDYADWWKEQAALLTLVPAVERELMSKNPRSFDRVVSRVSKDPVDFVDRFGAFLLKHFANLHGNEFLTELKRLVEERGKISRSVWPLPGDGVRFRESNRECNKGNEWACKLLGLPAPVRSAPVRNSPASAEKKKRQRNSVGGSGGPGGEDTPGEGVVLKKALQGTEDLVLPDANSLPKKPFKPVICSVPQNHLLDLFSICEFVSAFGPLVLGHDSLLSPSQLQEWVSSTKVCVDYEIFLRDLMLFIGNEGKDPSVRGFGAPSENELMEEEAANVGDDQSESFGVVPPLGRLRKLITFLGQMTWGEILRRFLHVFRGELSPDLLREAFAALESWNFGGLPAGRKLEITAFLVRKCLHSKRVLEAVDESLVTIAKLKGEKAKAIKDVKSEFALLLKTPCPPKPEAGPQLVELRRQISDREAELEQLRSSGAVDRSLISKSQRGVVKLKREAEDLLEVLQTAYDNVALAPERQAVELNKIKEQFDGEINEQKAKMRIEPLGQDRHHRKFWHFDVHRDTHDIVMVHDVSTESWSLIDSADELLAFRNKLNIRGLRERRLRVGIDEALPRLRQFAQEEADILGNPRLKRRQGREHMFGRLPPKDEDNNDDDDEEGKAQQAAQKAAKSEIASQGEVLDEAAQLDRMKVHLTKCMQELPTGSIKPKV